MNQLPSPDEPLDWSRNPDALRKLAEFVQGKRQLCHHCLKLMPTATSQIIGVLADGAARWLCAVCASEERNYARFPSEECEQCGAIRKQLGSNFCSRACEARYQQLTH